MKTKHVESLEEMVFRNKNKLYGAYSLRKKYNKYLTLSMLFAFFILLASLAYPVVASYLTRNHTYIPGNVIIDGPIPLPPPDVAPPPPPPPPPPPDVMKAAKFSTPTIIPDSIVSDFGKQSSLADNKPGPVPVIDAGTDPVPDKVVPVIEQKTKPEPKLFVEEMPMFPGGEQALFTFLGKNLKYPEEAKQIGISGRVIITFVVETNGSISEITVSRGIGPVCDEEAVRVVRSMPSWTPGKQNNIPVRVRLSLPVSFVLH